MVAAVDLRVRIVTERGLQNDSRRPARQHGAVKRELRGGGREAGIQVMRQRIVRAHLQVSVAIAQRARVFLLASVEDRFETQVVEVRIEHALMVVVVSLAMVEACMANTEIEDARMGPAVAARG